MDNKETYTYWLAEYTGWGGNNTFFVLKDSDGDYKRFINDRDAIKELAKERESDKKYNITDRKYRITKFTVTEEKFPITFNESVQLELFPLKENTIRTSLAESIHIVYQALGYSGVPKKYIKQQV